MAQITVKTGTEEPGVDVLSKGHIGLMLDSGNEAIYTGDSDTSPSNPVKITNNYKDADKTKLGLISATEPIDLDAVGIGTDSSNMYEDVQKELMNAVCEAENDGTVPIPLESINITVPITEAVESNDVTIIDINAGSDLISLKKVGRYVFAIVSDIESGTAETGEYVISVVDGDMNLIDPESFSTETIVAGASGENTKVYSTIVVDITAAVDIWFRVKTTLATSFVFNGMNASVLVDSHNADVTNPHAVTAEQVGLGNVEDTSDADKPVSDDTQTALNSKANETDLTSHKDNVSNPHGVAKSQVGLGNVDNTSDADKPVSTATQTALDLKQNSAELAGAIGNINSPLLDLPLQNSLSMRTGAGSVSFTRTTTATYIDRGGVLQYAAIDEPRFEKDGLLIEDSGTNLLVQNSIGNIRKDCTQSDGNIGVDGVTLFNKFTSTIDSPSEAYIDILNIPDAELTDGEKYTFSIFIDPVECSTDTIKLRYAYGNTDSVRFRISTESLSVLGGAPDDYGFEKIGNFYRIWITSTYATHESGLVVRVQFIDHAIDDTISFQFTQLEALPFASSYIPTTDSAVTRGADDCTATGCNNSVLRNSFTNLTISIEYKIPGYSNTLFQQLVSVSGNTLYADVQGRAHINYFGGGLYTTIDGTVGQTLTGVRDANTSSQIMYINGEIVETDTFTSFDDNVVIQDIVIGSSLYGHIKNFKVYDKALTATEINLLGGTN